MERDVVDGPARLFAPLMIVAAAIRLAINNVVHYSRADETVYLVYVRALAEGGGYPKIVRMFIGDPGMWVFPNPLRWSWLGAGALFCGAAGDCSHRMLATLSTVAGIAAVALTYWIARELFGSAVALLAAAFVTTSPLQLALGRRALADEFFCAALLASIAALLLYTRSANRAWLVAWIAATAIAIAAKEQFLFLYPVILFFWWLRTRRIGWVVVGAAALPPVLFAGVFSALARDAGAFFRIAGIITSAMTAPYAEQYQSGPPHRLLIDSAAVAPIITFVAVAAMIVVALRPSGFTREHRHLVILTAGILAIHAVLPSQNLRYIVAADPLLRILAAALLVAEVRVKPWLVAIAAVNAAAELKLFHDIFIAAAVYDPVTDNLFRALRMLPR